MNTPATIFLVDDVAANRDTLRELLDGQGYQVVEAADGPTALQLAAETPPDLVLLDVMMPGMDGYEVCRRLRADARLAEVPVIMVTALDDQASRLAGLEADADDFITKPFNRAELRARVHTITRLNRYRRLLDAEQKLRDSEARFHQLAEHSNEVFWFVTLRPEKIAYVSPAVEKIWGLPAEQFYEDARRWLKAIHPDEQPVVRATFDAVLAGASARFEVEYRVVRPDGAVRWVLDTGTGIRNGRGEIVSIGGVARDITERKEAGELMLRAQRLENIGMLAAGIAHDFNNALAPIIMAGPLVRQHVSNSSGLSLLDMMEKSAERSAGLVRQLLSFARGASGQSQLLQVRHVLQEVIDLAGATFPKSIRVESHLPGDLWPVQANPTQLHQIFLNLCVNARDAMPQGGNLTLTAANRALDAAAAAGIAGAQPGAFLAIEVRDTGTGIPPEVLARIWEPFYTTMGEGTGTGLGLSTVHGIVQNHRGFVTVQTRVGHGTAFTVYLPAAEGATGGGEPGARAVQPRRGEGELILVVDDEEPVRLLTASILTGHGYRVVTARDGAEAIAVFAPRAAEVRLLLTDSDMPMLGGPALAAALRRLKPALPVVSMSGADSRVSAAHQEFTTAFLAKPFQAEALLSLVRRTLDEARPPVSSQPAT
ncbi:MAG: response regulator [Verrucomicrobia bacterium]|nr:response regulator [Verrucomicrobiota bacterium]